MIQPLTYNDTTRDDQVLRIIRCRKAILQAALRICGVIAIGESDTQSAHDAAEFHLDGLLEERDRWESQSRLAYALACRIAPEYGVTLPWRIRLTRGWWV